MDTVVTNVDLRKSAPDAEKDIHLKNAKIRKNQNVQIVEESTVLDIKDVRSMLRLRRR